MNVKVRFIPTKWAIWIFIAAPYVALIVYLLLPRRLDEVIQFVFDNFSAIMQLVTISLLIGFRVDSAITKRKYIESTREHKRFITEKAEIIDAKQRNIQVDVNSLAREVKKISKEHVSMKTYVEILMDLFAPKIKNYEEGTGQNDSNPSS